MSTQASVRAVQVEDAREGAREGWPVRLHLDEMIRD